MATSKIRRTLNSAFLTKIYSGKYSLAANEAKGIHGDVVGYNSPPTGYKPVAFKHIDTGHNSAAFRYVEANGYSANSTLIVIKNLTATAISNATVLVEILFVRSDLIGA